MNMLKLAAILLLLCSAGVARAELQVHVGKAVFGLPPSAPKAAFIERLGPPTAELPLRQGWRGLLYGNGLLLAFEGETLREVRCWKIEQFTSDLFLGWLQQVEPRADLQDFVVDDRLRLGMPRAQVSAWLTGLEGDGDERSDVRIKNGQQLWLGYGRAPDYHLGDDPEQQVLVSISLRFNSH